jgi:hypothetical protein
MSRSEHTNHGSHAQAGVVAGGEDEIGEPDPADEFARAERLPAASVKAGRAPRIAREAPSRRVTERKIGAPKRNPRSADQTRGLPARRAAASSRCEVICQGTHPSHHFRGDENRDSTVENKHSTTTDSDLLEDSSGPPRINVDHAPTRWTVSLRCLS